jgi:hypothetical protein
LKTEDWGRSRVLVPAAVYLLLALAWSWPLPLHLANRFTHDPGDPLLVTYLIWWNAHAIPLTRAWWNAPYYYPLTDTLALTEHLAGLSPVTTPIQWLGGSPLLAYNLVLIASTWWSGLATHALVRRLTGCVPAAYCAGLAFAFAPYRTSQLAHLQLYACWWLPVILLSLHAYYEERRARWLIPLGIGWLLQGLTNGYFLLFLPVLVGLWLAWFTRRAEIGRAVRAGAALALASAAALPFLLHYRAVHEAQGLARSVNEMRAYSAYPAAFLSATPMLRFWHTAEPRTTEQYLFPGVTALALVVAGLFVSQRARRDRRFQFYAGAALVMAALSFGPAKDPRTLEVLWHPYSWLAWLPGFGGLRVPTRMYMLAVLCLAIAAGIAFAHLRERLRWRTALAALVLAGLAVDGAISGMPLGFPPGDLALEARNARVLVLPYEDGHQSVVAMYRSMSHRLPVVNGYAGYIPSSADVVEWGLRRRDPTILTELRRGHPLYVMVAATEQADQWTAFMDAQPGQLTGIQEGGRVYLMPAAPYAREVRPGARIDPLDVRVEGDWIVADARQPRGIRSLELRTHGNLVRLPKDLRIDISADGIQWQTVFEERPGGLALAGALELPRVIPLRVDLLDVTARFVRVNTPAFRAGALTLYGS